MEHKAVNFIIQGMQRDLNIARYDQNFAYENMNIRLTAMDNKTLLAVTNEKGNKKIFPKYKDENGNLNSLNILGNYIGHCIVGKYLVLFTKGDLDYIYKFIFENNELIGDLLFSGNLNFQEEHPIESIGVYENENVQKVYWVDGINPARYINIQNAKYKDVTNNNTIFDFTGEVPFPSSFNIDKINNMPGVFASGIIQYSYSFFDTNGRESNLIDVSSLNYITNSDRGGDAESTCNNCFKISILGINNKNYKYNYIRLYSIHRTSIDAIPTTKVVTDIELSLDKDIQDIEYIDTGLNGFIVDPYELLYKGGENIIPYTICHKDGTLFLGNFKSSSNKIDNEIKEEFKKCKINFTTKPLELAVNSNSFYDYNFQLNNSADKITFFKQGETYRYGVQLQDINGKWSEPIFIEDKETPYMITSEDNIVNLPMPYLELSEELKTKINKRYKRIRGVIVQSRNSDRTIISQGILCPTLFNLSARTRGNLTAQSSWFIRPFSPDDFDSPISSGYNKENNSNGAAAEFRHEHLVPVDNGEYNMEINVAPFGQENRAPKYPWGEYAIESKFENSLYYVDQSIFTFHSPEFVFSDEYNNIDNQEAKLKIIGFVPFTSFISDISITTESAGIKDDIIKDYIKVGVKGPSELGYRGLISGLFYRDHNFINDEKEGYKDRLSSETDFLIFPWHRNGSLNDTPKLSKDKIRSAILKRKVMSNLKYSINTKYLDVTKHWEAYVEGDDNKTGLTGIKLFNSNELSVVKLPKPKNSNFGDIIYSGNIDTIATGYNLMYTSTHQEDFDSALRFYSSDEIIDAQKQPTFGKDPVSIKYKSTPHLVMSLNYSKTGQQRILPLLNGLNFKQRESAPSWTSGDSADFYLQEIGSGEDYDSTKNYIEIYSIDRYPTEEELLPYLQHDEIDKLLIFISSENKFYRCKRIIALPTPVAEWEEKEFPYQEYFKYYNGDVFIYYKWTVNYDSDLGISADTIEIDTKYGGLYLAEIYQAPLNRFSNNKENEENLWIPAGKAEFIEYSNDIKYTEGDTYYQRFDCLKTYPYTQEDQNSIVEIASFMCETHINIDGRYDRNRGQNNNISMSPTNFNLFNPIYNQKNNFFNYRILSEDFNITDYPSSITWSLSKTLGEKIDSWTKFNLSTLLDLDGNNGDLQKIEVLNNELYSFQNKAIAKILFNSRVQIPTSEGIPIEIANSGKVDGKVYLTQEIGTINKWSILTTPNGTYFIDNNNFGIYLLGNGIKCISDMLNMSSVIKEHSNMSSWNPKDFGNFRCFYDKINSDVYFVNKQICLCYNELLGQFTSFYSYENTPMMINIEDKFLSFKDSYLWEFFKGDYNSFYNETKPFYITFIANPEPVKDKLFNNLDFRSDTYYGDTLLDRTFDTLEVWNEYQRGKSKLANIIGRPSNLKKKFRVWRAQIPRHNNSLQRIRNPWCYIKLSMDNPSNYKTILYDATLSYSV